MSVYSRNVSIQPLKLGRGKRCDFPNCKSLLAHRNNSGKCKHHHQKRKFTDAEFLKLYREGLNDYQVAEELGVCQATIFKLRRKKGLQPNGTNTPYQNSKR